MATLFHRSKLPDLESGNIHLCTSTSPHISPTGLSSSSSDDLLHRIRLFSFSHPDTSTPPNLQRHNNPTTHDAPPSIPQPSFQIRAPIPYIAIHVPGLHDERTSTGVSITDIAAPDYPYSDEEKAQKFGHRSHRCRRHHRTPSPLHILPLLHSLIFSNPFYIITRAYILSLIPFPFRRTNPQTLEKAFRSIDISSVSVASVVKHALAFWVTWCFVTVVLFGVGFVGFWGWEGVDISIAPKTAFRQWSSL